MKRTLLLLGAVLSLSVAAQAQSEETLFGRNSLDFTGFWFASTNNFSFLEDESTYFSGGEVGFEFGRTLHVGWAWQRSRDDIRASESGFRYDLRHRGFYMAVTPNPDRVFHPRLSVIAGTARVTLNNGDRDRVFAVTPAAGLELNLFRWFRLGMEGGYRLVSTPDLPPLDGTKLSSPFLQLNLRFGYSWGYSW